MQIFVHGRTVYHLPRREMLLRSSSRYSNCDVVLPMPTEIGCLYCLDELSSSVGANPTYALQSILLRVVLDPLAERACVVVAVMEKSDGLRVYFTLRLKPPTNYYHRVDGQAALYEKQAQNIGYTCDPPQPPHVTCRPTLLQWKRKLLIGTKLPCGPASACGTLSYPARKIEGLRKIKNV